MEWMAWTLPTALFFVAIAVMLAVMGVLQVVYPTVERKGWLPMRTTRGDRLFIGLLGSGYIHLAWLGLTADLSLWWASAISAVWLAALLRWG
jgi:predicted small integral membrane protein